jgi:hypothetical protein
MPWKETDAVKKRVKFLLEWEARWYAGDGRTNFAALCREFGVSRQIGYDLVARYRKAQHNVSVAAARSRRPHTSRRRGSRGENPRAKAGPRGSRHCLRVPPHSLVGLSSSLTDRDRLTPRSPSRRQGVAR